MAIFTAPTSFRTALERRYLAVDGVPQTVTSAAAHASHPSFPHLLTLVFEAVLEVVCVSLPGYIAARQGMFDADAQKLVANLNVALFTPCLVFTKLASQLTAEKFTDLAIIPAIFVVMTAVSYFCSYIVARLFRFKKRQANFVTAMGVFGNSNSLPISLVISLSQTLKGLHWSAVPNDNDDEVAARGILYLLIFQQLGQLVRWTWGYHVLLAPKERFIEEGDVHSIHHGQEHYLDNPQQTDPDEPLLRTGTNDNEHGIVHTTSNSVTFDSGAQTPVTDRNLSYTKLPSNGSDQSPQHRDVVDSDEDEDSDEDRPLPVIGPPPNGPFLPRQSSTGHILTFPDVEVRRSSTPVAKGIQGFLYRWRRSINKSYARMGKYAVTKGNQALEKLPPSVQKFLTVTTSWISRFLHGVWEFMNPPLWAMLIAIVVASIPSLQSLFFDEGTFVRNSITRAIDQNGQVAVPLILVVLGANLARNTLPEESVEDEEENAKEERNLIIASLIARMLLPTLIMAPLLALLAKYAPVSILDDPIFIIVCFLLTGAPSALQLAQICQINNVFMGAMSKLLFQSYVVWILPSTLILVMTALEVVEWATAAQ
ncbi:Auxin Efflux Carrier superfamily [Talaromyces stipitatus ATCC 10500]|uniref:Auxin Efflux Carrier superfamily n=1 Tax=Talaromyces stipitatus (strain ATCC 10500 / CBS 375.48 / QM 6759 / NRRL 1006) TaxID=441959 RepID=B8M208_TALSN|nr:Auxin Efflux Carrier superfamily [Talaromyces stipitatus ATCC 10500]EED21386.1 Auxin Efflux Carrier superfamily [Talaromyces stipitatus ATCC 10500]